MSYSINLAKLANGKAVTRLLNKVTLDLLEKGDRQWEYPWQLDTLDKEIGRGNVYILTNDQQLVGVFFLQTVTQLPGISLPTKSYYLSKMAVLPSLQGQDYGQLMLDYCRGVSLTHDVPVYLECAPTNHELKHFFQASGCDYLGLFSERWLFKLSDLS